MRKFYLLKSSLFFFIIFSFQFLQAQNFKLVKDINQQTNSNPSNAVNNSTSYAVLNGKAYFAADDGVHGVELWSSDGTEAGTALVKDINPGTGSFSVSTIYVFKNNIYFFASSNGINSQLWQSNGTQAGTKLIADNLPAGTVSSYYPQCFASTGTTLYFTAGLATEQIWKTDGTQAGTVLIADFNTGEYSFMGRITNFLILDEKLFFLTQGGLALWRSDGTKAGTQRFYHNYINTITRYTGLDVFDGKLYFSDNDNIYKSTSAYLTAEILTHTPQGDIGSFSFLKGVPYFIKYISADSTYNLFKYSNTGELHYELIKKLNHATFDNPATFIKSTNDSLLYFVADDSSGFQSLWVTDGTSNSTTVLKDDHGSFGSFCGAFGKLYFSHSDNSKGYELWRTDGSVVGTQIVKDINKNDGSSMLSFITLVGTSIFFAANTLAKGNELWKSDGTQAGTVLLKDINISATASSSPVLQPGFCDTINDHFIFIADDGVHGSELWTTDGTENGTAITKDILSAEASGLGYRAGTEISVRFKGKEYFFAGSPTNKYALYRTGGLPENTSFVTNVFTSPTGIKPYALGATSNYVFAIIYPYLPANPNQGLNASICRLYAYNGGAPVLLKDSFFATLGLGGAHNILGIKNNLYFFATPLTGTNELWRSDGTVQGTVKIKTVYLQEHATNPSYTGKMVDYKNQLFVILNSGYISPDPPDGLENGANYVWRSDGTADGTSILKNVKVSYNVQMIVSNNKLYFPADDGANGEELWITDGTTEGTYMVKDIMAGAAGASIYGLADLNGVLYFIANDGVHGPAIWKTDGTAAGTTRVANHSGQLICGNGKLYFIENNKLWQSDGTAAGTKQMDQSGLSGVTGITNLTYATGRLYFSGYSYPYGQELYTSSQSLLPITLLSFTGALQGNNSLLQWATINEQQNNYFNVQRSLNGRDFATIGKVNAHGGSKENDYNYVDAYVTALSVEKLYYRLQQIDLDGKFTFSKTIALDVPGSSQLRVTPNPAVGFTTVQSTVDIPNAIIKLVDMAGHVLYSTKQNVQAGNKINIPLAGYAKGVYSITIEAANKKKQEFKVVVE